MSDVSKSQMFRDMFSQGIPVFEVAKNTNSNYAFVYGVYAKWRAEHPETGELTHRKTDQGDSLSARIRAMYKEGKSTAAIRTELRLDYSFVFGVIKRMKQASK